MHVADVAADPYYSLPAIVQSGWHTALAVPILQDGSAVGAITVSRREVAPFSQAQIDLLKTFADQAAIAIENVRLFNELNERTRGLQESLKYQTATSDVLQVISRSTFDLQPVLDTLVETAARLCGADMGGIATRHGEAYRVTASYAASPEWDAFVRTLSFTPGRDTVTGRALLECQPVQIPDIAADLEHKVPEAATVGNTRTMMGVPLLREGEPIGVIMLARSHVEPFSERQIALVMTFADQAVIAMENARLLTETREALEQQTATAEVLQVINSSPGDLAPVFEAILDKAHRLCDVAHGSLQLYDGVNLLAVATHGVSDAFADILRHGYRAADSPASRGLVEGRCFVQIADCAEVDHPVFQSAAELAGIRTVLFVPLRKEDALLGLISSARREVRPFSDKEIALLENFAAQAVIAMENARLLGELQQRTGDLQESLEYQTAVSDVLKVISQSGSELGAVLDTLVGTAARICRADSGFIFRLDGGLHRMIAAFGIPAEYRDFQLSHPIEPGRGTLAGRTALERRAVHIEDAATDPEYTRIEAVQLGRQRTMLGVPLIREDSLIGVITLARSHVEPFTGKQIELVTTFADQAVIAIENDRLLSDLRQRTNDLQESLEYQTAVSDVLKVISRSTFDLDTMLREVVVTAIRLCRADHAVIYRRDGDEFRWGIGYGLPAEYEEIERNTRIRPGTGTVVGRAALEARTIQIPDAWNDPLYEAKSDARIGGVRTLLGVPLLREGEPIGVIGLARSRVEEFSEREIQLVTTFADQAVIAIENARLFNELRDRTDELGRSVEELKLLGEVGRAVSSTLDLRTVLSTILNASLGVTWANAGAIFRYIRAERSFRLVEAAGWDDALKAAVGDLRVPEAETAMGQAAAWRTPIQIDDLALRPSTPLRDASLVAGLRSALIVPLVGAERVFGALVLQRRETGEFPPEAVRLVQTLASQSVLAIQNARLYREIADKSEQLALASQHKSQFLANMSHELRTPLNAMLGYAELLVDGIYGALTEKAQGVLERMQSNGQHLLALINDVLDLAKIEAGQLTLSLEDYALPEVVHSVVSATEPLAAAKGLKFTVTLQDGLPMAYGDARRVAQILLNLVGNAVKFTEAGEVAIRATAANGQFVLEVRDTGPGIADADQDRIFGEFQQIDNTSTRRQGGTGLGLAISKRMVEMQGGIISVESAPGRGSIFRVVLPVHVEPALEQAA